MNWPDPTDPDFRPEPGYKKEAERIAREIDHTIGELERRRGSDERIVEDLKELRESVLRRVKANGS